MVSLFRGAQLPYDLTLEGTSFKSGVVSSVVQGLRNGIEYVTFHWNANNEASSVGTVVAIKIPSPVQPETWLSRTSGLRLERVGDWVFAVDFNQIWHSSELEAYVDDVLKLLDYAGGLPQNQ